MDNIVFSSHAESGIVKLHVGERRTVVPSMWLMLHVKIS